MSTISGVNNNLVQAQLSGAQTRAAIDTEIAAKTLDMARDQGQMALKLLDEAAQIGEMGQGANAPGLGAIVSGIGQNIDVRA